VEITWLKIRSKWSKIYYLMFFEPNITNIEHDFQIIVVTLQQEK